MLVEVVSKNYKQHGVLAKALFEYALQTKTSKEKMVAKRNVVSVLTVVAPLKS